MRVKSIQLLFISIVIVFTSCNFYKIREHHVEKKFIKAGLESKYLNLKDTTLHYWVGGSGNDTMMLIHGFGADSRFQWYDQVKILSKRYKLIVPDLVYFNQSRSSSNNYSVDFQADTIIALIKELGIDHFSMIGVSYGGLVAITICDTIPDKIDRLIISDSPIKYYTLKHNEKALKKYNAATIQELLIPSDPKNIPRLLELAYYKPPWVPGFVLSNVHENMFIDQAKEKGALLEYLKQNEKLFSEKEYTVHCRVLLLWGKHDLLIPPEIGYKLQKYLGDKATLVIVDKAAHMPNLEKPKAFNKIIMDFLKE